MKNHKKERPSKALVRYLIQVAPAGQYSRSRLIMELYLLDHKFRTQNPQRRFANYNWEANDWPLFRNDNMITLMDEILDELIADKSIEKFIPKSPYGESSNINFRTINPNASKQFSEKKRQFIDAHIEDIGLLSYNKLTDNCLKIYKRRQDQRLRRT